MGLDRYKGPIVPGLVFTGPDNDGELGFRRDLVLARHPFDTNLWIFQALPCRMRKHGEGTGTLGLCPDLNLRIVLQPEIPEGYMAVHGRPFGYANEGVHLVADNDPRHTLCTPPGTYRDEPNLVPASSSFGLTCTSCAEALVRTGATLL